MALKCGLKNISFDKAYFISTVYSQEGAWVLTRLGIPACCHSSCNHTLSPQSETPPRFCCAQQKTDTTTFREHPVTLLRHPAQCVPFGAERRWKAGLEGGHWSEESCEACDRAARQPSWGTALREGWHTPVAVLAHTSRARGPWTVGASQKSHKIL